jgi:hypothetical protein
VLVAEFHHQDRRPALQQLRELLGVAGDQGERPVVVREPFGRGQRRERGGELVALGRDSEVAAGSSSGAQVISALCLDVFSARTVMVFSLVGCLALCDGLTPGRARDLTGRFAMPNCPVPSKRWRADRSKM